MNPLRWPFWVWPLGAIVLILGVSGVSWLPRFTTSDPDFCLSCHSRGDTPYIGEPSLVHPGWDKVSCTQCHAEPGQQVIVDLYKEGVSADPERLRNNCLRCHSETALTNEQDGFKFNKMEIRIPHRFHVETVGAECVDCHRNIAHDKREKPTNRPRMDYCYTCHSQSDSCLKCHQNGIPTPPEMVTPKKKGPTSGEQIYKRNCAMCHGPRGDQLPGTDLSSVEFLNSRTDATLTRAITQGTPSMPAFGGSLSPEEIQALVKLMRSWGHK
jgi:cytochrome c5